MSKRKVYVVTKGEYSDYGIEAIYSSKRLAEAHVSRHNEWKAAESVYHPHSDRCNEVEVWELNSYDPLGKLRYYVALRKNGDLDHAQARGFNTVDADASRFLTYRETWGHPRELALWVDLVADSIERAIKVANEIRLRELASNHWGIEAPNRFRTDVWRIWESAAYALVSGKPLECGSVISFHHDSVGNVIGTIDKVGQTWETPHISFMDVKIRSETANT